jgi:acetyltransferase
MGTLNLRQLFSPRSVAVIGASDKPGSVGQVVLGNLLNAGFTGEIHAVNPGHSEIMGRPCYPDVAALPGTVDMAVFATPAAVVPGVISQLGELGTRAAVVLSAGFHETGKGTPNRQQLLDAACPFGLRLLGPNCLGFLNPKVGLNASFAHMNANAGNLAFVAQSGALCTAVIDWAAANNVGFTHVISLGDMLDVDFGDVIDYLGDDGACHGILLYVESIYGARKFMSAARAVSRNKPIIAIKAGRNVAGMLAAKSHTGAMAGSYAVFESAFRRAGIVMVDSVEQLFDVAETLSLARPLSGARLAIVTNGGGPGVLAVDALISQGGKLARLDAGTLQNLDGVLPATWSRGNPVDIIGDAHPERYVEALKMVADDPYVDAILVINVPTALASSAGAARAVIDIAPHLRVPIITNWMGESTALAARQLFVNASIPSYETPHMAIKAFLTMGAYHQTQELLLQTPPSIPDSFSPNITVAREQIVATLDAGRDVLSEPESKALLQAYGFPVVPTRNAKDIDDALTVAKSIGYPIAAKILSPDITHKSDVGGVALDIETPEALRAALEGMLLRVNQHKPQARIEGFSLQRMIRRPRSRELILGASTDPIFGPVILFGDGGTAVEILADKAIALPPLNLQLARDLIARTRVYKLLKGYRDHPAADLDAIALALVRLSQLLIDMPEVCELDINPLLADAEGVIALDARVRVQKASSPGTDRLAIRPYPSELEETIRLPTGESLLVRPVRPEDEPAHMAFFEHLDPEDIYFRFFTHVEKVTHLQIARFTQIDYDREMAFIATRPGPDGHPETVAVVRAVSDANHAQAEFAVIVRSDLQRRGLGTLLMDKIVRHCRELGVKRLVGQMLKANREMIALAVRLGFVIDSSPEDSVVSASLPLN